MSVSSTGALYGSCGSCSMTSFGRSKESRLTSISPIPKAGAEDKYEKIFGEFRFAEIELIAVFHLPGSGKIPDKVCELADVWLRRAVKQGTQRCVLALSFPNYQEEKLRESLRKLKLRK